MNALGSCPGRFLSSVNNNRYFVGLMYDMEISLQSGSGAGSAQPCQTRRLVPSPGGFFEMVDVVCVSSVPVEVCTKGVESDVPEAAEFDFFDVLCSDADAIFYDCFQFIVSIVAVHGFTSPA